MEPQGMIVVRRPRAGSDIVRAYRIEIDGQVVARIRQHHSVAIPVEPGPHRFRALIDWTGSAPVELLVPAGSPLTVTVRPARGALAASRHLGDVTGWIAVSVDGPEV